MAIEEAVDEVKVAGAATPGADGELAPATFTSSTASSIAIAAPCRFSQLRPIFQAARSVPILQETHPEFLFQGCSYYCQLVSTPA